MDSIRRANILELVFIITLIIAEISFGIGYNGSKMFGISLTAAKSWDIIGRIFEIAFVCILSYSMRCVNNQLALFFKQVGIRNYP